VELRRFEYHAICSQVRSGGNASKDDLIIQELTPIFEVLEPVELPRIAFGDGACEYAFSILDRIAGD
jgi:hypothetical protein